MAEPPLAPGDEGWLASQASRILEGTIVDAIYREVADPEAVERALAELVRRAEAADRLQAERDEWKEASEAWAGQFQAAEREAARLREALERIAAAADLSAAEETG